MDATGSPIFIFGCTRSGTSLLSRMIGAHPRIAVPFESHVYNTFYPWLRHYGDLGRRPNRERLVDDMLSTEVLRDWNPRPDRNRTLAAIERFDLHGVFEALMRAWTNDVGKRRWGEKTPPHVYWWPQILEGFPDMRVIHIVRDGRDVALSWKSARFGPKHSYLLAREWVRYLRTVGSLQEAIPARQFLELRYEDLVASAEPVLRRTCGFLQEEYMDDMLRFYEEEAAYRTDQRNLDNLRRPLLTRNVGKWKERMSPRDLRIFEAVAGGMLDRLGYERALARPTISRAERWMYRYVEHPPRKALAMLKNRKGHVDGLRRLGIYLRLRLNPPPRRPAPGNDADGRQERGRS